MLSLSKRKPHNAVERQKGSKEKYMGYRGTKPLKFENYFITLYHRVTATVFVLVTQWTAVQF